MSKDWESTFSFWSKGPSKTETEKCENAIRAIKNAISKSEKLTHRDINVFLQGSYRNRVNVRQDSDVDIGIVCKNTFFYKLPENFSKADFSIADATYHYSDFKTDVYEALVDYFGKESIVRSNKVFDIKENSYRIDADLAPFFDYRHYLNDGNYIEGVKLLPDNGGEVINWPDQHYNNGVEKNTSTSRKFKGIVRILKNLKNEMGENGISSAKQLPGFLAECLVFNVENSLFERDNYILSVRAVLAELFNNTLNDQSCNEWTEVNDIKYLFHSSQPWNRNMAHTFLSQEWDFVGYE